MPEPIIMELGIYIMPPEPISKVYYHKSLLSVIPVLQPFRLLRQNLDFA
jgi:hypothetical protein